MPLVFLLFALFASVFTIGKTGLDYSQPFFLVGTRMSAAGVLMLCYMGFTNPKQLIFSKREIWLGVKLAVFNIYLTNIFEFWGLKYLTAFKTCYIYSLSPFIVALLSFIVFSEKMSVKKWMGLLIGCIGIVPILLLHGADELDSGELFLFSWAEMAVLAACICGAYGWIILKQLVNEYQIAPMAANGLSMTIGGLFALIHSSMTEPWDPFPVTEWIPFLECTCALILISNCVCYNLYGYLLKKYSATFMSFAGFTTPLFTALFGWIFLGETISWEVYLSMAIIFAGLYIFNLEELKTVSLPSERSSLT